ncbi:hypothetical protein HFD88_005545 [Aspergillus terreus]|nr:hypothetical protein HFD88_005545 [Aspergillus terreus]
MAEIARNHTDYTIAWICALPLEAAAACAMLDEIHPKLPQPKSDHNIYTLGAVSGHNIVVACLPLGAYGTISAAVVATQTLSTFTEVRFGLMVGVGGGIPRTAGNDMRLGDIVVSKPTTEGTSGVVAYDFGKVMSHGEFASSATLNRPPQILLNTMSQLQVESMMGKSHGILDLISSALTNHPEMARQYSQPNHSSDCLFQPEYVHATGEADCAGCDAKYLVERPERNTDEPRVHYGLIASGNQLIRDSMSRDRIAQRHGALCFDMEAAGLMNQLPVLVIRGICDYCDSHKSKTWQGYASMTAASYAKILLSKVPSAKGNTILKTPSTSPRSFMVPFPRNTQFLSRESELSRLEAMITSRDGGRRRAALSGLGGVGKTHIALELAYRLDERAKEYSIFWIPSTSVEAAEQALMDVSRKLGLDDIPTENTMVRVYSHLSSEAAGPWVLIIDNADDPSQWPTSMAKDVLPTSAQGFTLFTTRNHQLATKMVGPNVIKVVEMDMSSAVTLFRHTLSNPDLCENDMLAISLARHLRYLPLAIVQAASYMAENLISIQTYLSLLEDTEASALELLSKDFEDEWRYADAENPITSTWLVSFRQIQALNPLAADYLTFMSCVSSSPVPLSLLPAAESRVKQQSALGVLKAYHLVAEIFENGVQSFSLHRLVQLATQNWLKIKNIQKEWINKIGQHLKDVFPADRPDNRVLWRSYLPHAQRILGHEDFHARTRTREDLAHKVAQSLYSDGRYRDAEVLFREVWRERHAQLGPEHSDTLEGLECVVAALWNQGQWKKIEELQVSLLEARQMRLGSDDPAVLSSLGNLASTLMNQGRWSEAQALELKVLAKFKSLLGDDHPRTLTSMANLATTYRMQGEYSKAEDLDVWVLHHRTKVLGSEHSDTMNTMGNLACTYMEQGRWSQAEELMTRQLSFLKATIGPGHPETLTAMGNLATTYREQGKRELAEELEVYVSEQSRTVLGPEHPITLISMANLASTYRRLGRLAEAETLEMEATETLKSALGPNHPVTLRSVGNLASTMRGQGKYKECEELEEQVTRSFRSMLGADHPDTLTSISNLACTYRYQGRYVEAEKLEVEVLKARRQLLGSNHPHTLTSMWNLARTWRQQQRNTESLELLQACVRMQNQRFGPDHPDTVEAASELESWQSSAKTG